jgi:Carboxypeptidase regulatory-like domain/TonB dependent receptor
MGTSGQRTAAASIRNSQTIFQIAAPIYGIYVLDNVKVWAADEEASVGHKLLVIRAGLLLGIGLCVLQAESNSELTGRVVDPSDRAVPDAVITVRNLATLVESTATANNEGIFEIAALPVGTYRMQVKASGFRLYAVEPLVTDVARTVVQDVRLEIGDISQQVTVRSQAPLIDTATASLGHVIDGRTVQEIPLNGRHLLDLAMLSPGSVSPSQTGFNTTPSRGLGALAINTAGNREDAVNYMINGVTLNDQLLSGILFQPSISSVDEFKIDNSTFSAEYGQNSGAIVNVATRSGGSQFHGELFEFLRNDALDARNFFTFTSSEPPPFKRNQFGANLGGQIVKGRTFFFFSYEGLRQVQDVDLNSVVLSDAQRQSVTDPLIAKLIERIPHSNYIDSTGTPRFVGSASAPVDGDQWGLDISHIFNKRDRLHGYYTFYRTTTIEPTARGTSIPGFGYDQAALRQFFSLNETHIFGPNQINELRLGLNRISSSTVPIAELNPADFGIRDGITQPIGLPQISVAGGALNFGGPSTNPSGRGDTMIVAGDTMNYLFGRLSLKIGGEYRRFLNNNFRLGTGTFNFASVGAFLADTANSFSVTLGSQSSSIVQGALGFFIQTNYNWRPNFTLEVGLRYDWNMTPEESHDRFIVFDPASASLLRVGQGVDEIYHQNNKNLQPRVGFSWDPFKDGKTAVRGAYAVIVAQPITNVVAGTAGNPPLALPLTFSGPIRFDNAIDLAQAAGLAPLTVDHGFDNAYLQSWNFNVQREVLSSVAVMAGYIGSKATHLTLQRNINQPVDGVRPFPAVSQTSPILPGTPLGNITQTESTGNSNYNALWVSVSKTLAHGFQIDASYTWSKSLDYNSLSTLGTVVQDSYNPQGDRGLSDYDARHRFVARGIYDLPFRGNRFVEGWQLAAVLQAQSGNPVNIVTANSTITGVANTIRPNVTGPITMIDSVDRWFDTSVFTSGSSFGNLGRNVVIGPGFDNTDVSLMKNTAVTESLHVQLRIEFFDVFNHANFGQPGNVVGSPGFGRITNTRLPTGESGSSRQIQLGIKVLF